MAFICVAQPSHELFAMPPKNAAPVWARLLFLALTPVVALLVCAPNLGLVFPDWPAASLEGLGALALIGAFASPADPARWWS